MHKTLLAAMMAILTLGSAQAAGPSVEVSAQKLRSVRDYEFQEIKGRYQMSDGRVMDVVRRGGEIVANLEREDSATLRANDALNLRSVDGRMALRFIPNGRGDHVDVVVTLYGEAGRVAQVLKSAPGG